MPLAIDSNGRTIWIVDAHGYDKNDSGAILRCVESPA
jgi:hypothetical protein